MSVEKLIASKNPIKIWIAARYFYRIGDPIITDELYEEYTTLLKEHPNTKRVLHEYFIRTYDEDQMYFSNASNRETIKTREITVQHDEERFTL